VIGGLEKVRAFFAKSKMADSSHHVDMLANVENAVWHAFDFLGK
jgi:hypothetical protein